VERVERGRGGIAALALVLWVAACCVGPFAVGTARADAIEPASEPDRFDTIVLDAGHGGEDEGARSPAGLIEKDVVLDVTRRLRDRLETLGHRVVLTRDADEKVSLRERVDRANTSRGDLFVSIHANAAPQDWVRGVETFFLSLEASDEAARALAESENRAFEGMPFEGPAGDDALLGILGDLMVSEHMTESNEFARMAQQALALRDSVRSRGVKQAPFVVLMGVRMPACLVEIGFLSNARDERELAQDRRRDEIAEALALSILRFGERYDARRGVTDRPPVAARGN
jgi:N-acetylmuramoyl-L-alanine amidase